MAVYCPVCDFNFKENEVKNCPICGFDESGKKFSSEEEKSKWMSETIYPLRKEFAEKSNNPTKYIIIDDCLDCGLCVAECPSEAIAKFDEVYMILTGRCTKCGVCTEVCPVYAPRKSYV